MDKLFQFKSSTEGGNTRASQMSQNSDHLKQGGDKLHVQTDAELFGKHEYEPEEGDFDSTMRLPVKNHLHKLEVSKLDSKGFFS